VLAHRTLRSGPIPATISQSTDYASAKQLRYRRQKSRQLRQISGPYDPVIKNELLELASVCEEVASNIEDNLTGG
jgi:hypothetical protein